jgi:hypothetical protein
MAQWFIRRKGKKQAAHIWDGTDTLCRMASTGGLKLSRFAVTDDKGEHDICHMCAVMQKKQSDVEAARRR